VLYPLLAALLLTLPLMDWEILQIGGRSIVAPYVFAGMLAAAVLFHPRALAEQLRRDVAFPWIFCWLLIASTASLSLFLSSGREDVLAGNVSQIASLGLMVGHYFFIAAALRVQPLSRITRLIELFIAVAVVGSVLSLYQLASVIFGWPYEEFWRTSNLYFKAYTLNWHGGGSWITFPRAYGTAPEPTFWAGYLVCALAIALGRLEPGVPRRFRVAVLLILVGIVMTFSRAAVVPAAAVLGVWLWYLFRRTMPLPLTIGILAAALVATVWPAFASDRMMTMLNDHSAIERLSAQITGLRIVADYPFIGTGPGSVPFLVDKYLFVIEGRQLVAFSRLYSFFLLIMVATGVLGTLVFSVFLVELLRRVHTGLTSDVPAIAMIARSAILSYVAIIVCWVGSPAYNMSYIWFCLALASALPGRSAPPCRT
jgi:hypothetical protein